MFLRIQAVHLASCLVPVCAWLPDWHLYKTDY